eukprot:CCRYP_018465-RH/>CCRYP_018465-RH protein AED:0.48 eAED:0.81 QI:0/0/0/1/0/0/2/0/60
MTKRPIQMLPHHHPVMYHDLPHLLMHAGEANLEMRCPTGPSAGNQSGRTELRSVPAKPKS